MKKLCKIIIYIIGIIISLFMMLIIAAPIVNNYSAAGIAKKLRNIPLPEKTEYITSVSKAGKINGNGNGMQYLGCILIKSDLPFEDVKTYYSGYVENEWDCMVDRQEGQSLDFAEHITISFDTVIQGDNYYIVYTWGKGNSFFSELDIRGH